MTTTTSPLVERYLQAVSDAVGKSQRAEVTAEVRSALAEAVDSHLERGETIEAAELAAVTELGDPLVLAARFSGQPLHLIGPTQFPTYRRLLRTLELLLVPIVSIVVLLAQALDGAGPIEVLGSAIWTALQVAIQLAFWVTLVFAVLERTGVDSGLAPWTPAALPAVADRRISLADTVATIATLVMLIVALLLSRSHWLVTGASGTEVPVLDPDLWTFWMPTLVAILLATVVLEVGKYRVGRWTVTLATVNTVLSAAFAGLVVWLWTSDQLLNPEVVLSDGIATAVGVIPWVLVVISVIEIGQGWLGVRHGSQGRR